MQCFVHAFEYNRWIDKCSFEVVMNRRADRIHSGCINITTTADVLDIRIGSLICRVWKSFGSVARTLFKSLQFIILCYWILFIIMKTIPLLDNCGITINVLPQIHQKMLLLSNEDMWFIKSTMQPIFIMVNIRVANVNEMACKHFILFY